GCDINAHVLVFDGRLIRRGAIITALGKGNAILVSVIHAISMVPVIASKIPEVAHNGIRVTGPIPERENVGDIGRRRIIVDISAINHLTDLGETGIEIVIAIIRIERIRV
ncbi:hypothetical protein, partial [Bifidobacterium merycicum]|uniref:hypothetical protein n=1 Tax=Bifidobacterium merycicum TaxID=78345 RepID=UPI0013637F96